MLRQTMRQGAVSEILLISPREVERPLGAAMLAISRHVERHFTVEGVRYRQVGT